MFPLTSKTVIQVTIFGVEENVVGLLSLRETPEVINIPVFRMDSVYRLLLT